MSESLDEAKLEALEEPRQHPENLALPGDEPDLVHVQLEIHAKTICVVFRACLGRIMNAMQSGAVTMLMHGFEGVEEKRDRANVPVVLQPWNMLSASPPLSTRDTSTNVPLALKCFRTGTLQPGQLLVVTWRRRRHSLLLSSLHL